MFQRLPSASLCSLLRQHPCEPLHVIGKLLKRKKVCMCDEKKSLKRCLFHYECWTWGGHTCITSWTTSYVQWSPFSSTEDCGDNSPVETCIHFVKYIATVGVNLCLRTLFVVMEQTSMCCFFILYKTCWTATGSNLLVWTRGLHESMIASF